MQAVLLVTTNFTHWHILSTGNSQLLGLAIHPSPPYLGGAIENDPKMW